MFKRQLPNKRTSFLCEPDGDSSASFAQSFSCGRGGRKFKSIEKDPKKRTHNLAEKYPPAIHYSSPLHRTGKDWIPCKFLKYQKYRTIERLSSEFIHLYHRNQGAISLLLMDKQSARSKGRQGEFMLSNHQFKTSLRFTTIYLFLMTN